jgi:hypothetical protein
MEHRSQEFDMNKFVAAVAALSLSATAVFAGGPVVIADEGEPAVIVGAPGSGGALIPILAGVLILAAIASGESAASTAGN